MNICFIANYTKTYFFDAIADKLAKEGIVINWIVVNEGNYLYLLKKYPEANILFLPKDKVLNQDNLPIGDFKLNELIYGDRVLKYHYEVGFKYLTSIQIPIANFIRKQNIKFIFGEVTWAHEILIHRITQYVKDLDCQYLEMHTIRIPNGRFAFFKSEFQNEFLIVDPNFAEKKLPVNAFDVKKPDYVALMDKLVIKSMSLKARTKRLKAFITGENLDKNDITLMPGRAKQRAFVPIKNEINKETYRKVKTIGYEFLNGKKFVLATLHKQPEASIDVLGRYVEDQTRMILDLWRILPHGWFLVVKEHSNAIGDRSYFWFKNLAQYKNIVFANERLDSHILIEMCQAVYTVSGTVAYEAALKHKPALVLINVFYNLPFVKKVNTDLFRSVQNLQEILNQIPDKNIDEESIKKKIYFNSYPGLIGDPLNDPNCMKEENLTNVTNAILSIV